MSDERLSPERLVERFWAKVDQGADGCWEWRGVRQRNGYGQLSVAGRNALAHRVAWELSNGPIPAGLWVLHKCDNRPCVRPDHLYLGTVHENQRDTYQRHPTLAQKLMSAHPKGEAHPSAKLDAETVKYIRTSNQSLRELSRQLGLAYSTIREARIGKTWRAETC